MNAVAAEARPYHHGDLRRALVDAARRILEADGPSALSLRAVAREAGVSPAAPYHHFKAKVGPDTLVVTELGVAYVCFARDNPALYRVMYERSRDKDSLPEDMREDDESAYCLVRETFREVAGPNVSDMDIELGTIAAWCAAHGLAEMTAFAQFTPLKAELGGEEGFLRAVLAHLGMFARLARPA